MVCENMIEFYDSLRRTKVRFEPADKRRVTIYVCGITPYDHAHIGHARTYVAFDMIKRFLLCRGYGVFHIQNITDVDDKIIKRAKESGRDPAEIPAHYHKEALAYFDRLNILRADRYPKATEHIKEMHALIKRLMEKNHAYETETGVYYDVPSFKEYGKLSKQKLEQLKKGVRIEADSTKKHPYDFALWKKEKDLVFFESPWGEGRPGWHIECSAMAIKYGGETIDIHGGARDLIFPHHENEIAQSEGATGKTFSRLWMHTGFLTINGEKMSKSLGNFVTVGDVVNKFETNAIRLFFAQAHYRSPIDYDEDKIRQAEKTAAKMIAFRKALSTAKVIDKEDDVEFRNVVFDCFDKIDRALDDDFDMPSALAHFFKLMHVVNSRLSDGLHPSLKQNILRKTDDMFYIIGLKVEDEGNQAMVKEIIDDIVNLRTELRKNKQYEASDRIRDMLEKHGVLLEDGKEKTSWRFK